MKKSALLSVCPKTGRITGIRAGLPRILFPVTGCLALLWFLIRVVPKPSRATYPCQRVAAPLASSFLTWLLGTGGLALVLGRARAKLRGRANVQRARFAAAALALVAGLVCLGWTVLTLHQPAVAASAVAAPAAAAPAAYTPHPANAPIGAAKGLAPGRVAWAHDPTVTTWTGSGASGQRWYDKTDQAKATAMMQWAILGYTGKATAAEAWDAVFRHFNAGAAYQPGEKVFVKVNFVTFLANNCADANYNWTPTACGAQWTSIGESPQLMVALLDQLVNAAGVAQSNITIGDSTGLWVNELYNIVHPAFPGVTYLEARGTAGSGRTAARRSSVALNWSTTEANGKKQDKLLQAVVDAKYLVDFGVLKSHTRAGVTLTAKNHYGSLSGGNSDSRKPNESGYYDLHLRLPLDTTSGAWPDRAKMAQYRPLVDLNVHPQMSGKTILYLLDAIYAGRDWNAIPSKWRVQPFCTQPSCAAGTEFWPASLFLSMDQVAIDSVGFDLLSLKTDWPEVLQAEGVQDYLHELALVDNPPSGTTYDPERDGQRPASQGSHEHWNAASLKQYTRNLGSGAGIDLVYLTEDPTRYASARRTDAPPAIDAAVDAAWSSAPARMLANVVLGGGAISGGSDLSASFRTLYDDANLYLLVDITDDTLTSDSTAWADDDSVVLLIDGDYSRGSAYDGANDFELAFRWNDPAIYRGPNSAPTPPGTTFALAAVAAGYRLEVKLPLAGLGIPPGYARLFGLDVQVNDDDDGAARDAKLAWWGQDETGSTTPSALGPARQEGPEPVTHAAGLADPGVRLTWAHYAWNEVYTIHRSPAPYFNPDASTQMAEVLAPGSTYVDPSVMDAAYYVVRAQVASLGANSNRTGRFHFELTRP